MGAITEFIKENSPDVPEKKKKRVRLKNFNPFRKRKYKTLHEENEGRGEERQHSSLAGDQLKSSSDIDKSTKDTDNQAQKRRRPREFFFGARGSFGPAKDNPASPNYEGRKKARRHGSAERLIEEEATADVLGEEVKTEPKTTGSPPSENSRGETPDWGNVGPRKKHVTISDKIEVIEIVTEEQALPRRITKSAKKKLKKAGIKSARMLGRGLANMALTYQYLSPDASLASAAKDVNERREDRYRKMAGLAYAMAS